jgi:hypothetical protein
MRRCLKLWFEMFEFGSVQLSANLSCFEICYPVPNALNLLLGNLLRLGSTGLPLRNVLLRSLGLADGTGAGNSSLAEIWSISTLSGRVDDSRVAPGSGQWKRTYRERTQSLYVNKRNITIEHTYFLVDLWPANVVLCWLVAGLCWVFPWCFLVKRVTPPFSPAEAMPTAYMVRHKSVSRYPIQLICPDALKPMLRHFPTRYSSDLPAHFQRTFSLTKPACYMFVSV